MKYFCRAYGSSIEITEDQYMAAERAAGFHPKTPGRIATASFSNSPDISYRVEYESDFESRPDDP
jgi:hypothetical protein